LVHELAAFGAFGLFIAADRYKPDSGWAFSTYANYWIKKFIRLYLDEIIGIVPRTGHMGDDEPRRSVMDLVDAALNHRRQYRGKAAGGMSRFDSSLTIEVGDDDIEVSSDPKRLDYLQRRVSETLYPWNDVGSYQPNGKPWPLIVKVERLRQIELVRKQFGIRKPITTPRRFELPGHADGKAHDGPPQEDTYELDPRDEIEFTRGPRELKPNEPQGQIWPHRDIRRGWARDPIRDNIYLRPIALAPDKPSIGPGKPSVIPFLHLPHEVCYIRKHSPYYYDSWQTFEPQRRRRRKKRWRKPSIREDVWCALAA
jgi:hypothetical protein